MLSTIDIDEFLFWDGIVPWLVPLIISWICAFGLYFVWRNRPARSALQSLRLCGLVVWLNSALFFSLGLIADMWGIAGSTFFHVRTFDVTFAVWSLSVPVTIGLWLVGCILVWVSGVRNHKEVAGEVNRCD